MAKKTAKKLTLKSPLTSLEIVSPKAQDTSHVLSETDSPSTKTAPLTFHTYGGDGAPPAPPTVVQQPQVNSSQPEPLPSLDFLTRQVTYPDDTKKYTVLDSVALSEPQNVGVSIDTPAFPIALVCADIHLSPSPPAARIEEPDWLKAMETQMLWLFDTARKHEVPIVIAGDLFDKAIGDSRFISFVIELFSNCTVPVYVVAGNHDLPYHSYANVNESAYGILMATRSIRDIESTACYVHSSGRTITLHGFYWNREDIPPFAPTHINVAVIHKFIYDAATSYVGADPEAMCENQVRNIPHVYDFLIYGDNHTPFTKTTPAGSTLINCGSFFRRSQNDRNLKPAAYLLKADRSFETLYVPLEGQTFLQKGEEVIVQSAMPDYSELSEFFTETGNLVDNLTIRDAFGKFVASNAPSGKVKEHLSRITGMSFI